MTVTTTANSITYAANGVTAAFAFPYIFFAPLDLLVRLINDATGSETSNPPVLNGAGTYDYTVSGDFADGAYASGGTVTFNTAPPAGYTVSLIRAVPATQDVTLIDNTKFPAQTVNREFDKLTVLVQQSLAFAAGEPGGGGGGGGASTPPVVGGPVPPVAPVTNSLWWNSDAAPGGGALYFYYDDGFGAPQWVPASPVMGTQNLVQTVSYQTGVVATGTTVIPLDDTIPQIGEGTEFMTLSITPKSATSKLIIEVTAHLAHSAANSTIVAALFQDSGTNALVIGRNDQAAAGFVTSISFRHAMTSGTTSAMTFRIRAGSQAAGTMTFNGSGGARQHGGVMASSIVIQEVL